LIREVPLRQTIASSPKVGESFARPTEASSFTELQAQASSLARRENRRIVYERLNRRAGLDLTPGDVAAVPAGGDRIGVGGPAGRPRPGAAAGFVPGAGRARAGGGGQPRSGTRDLDGHPGRQSGARPAGRRPARGVTELLADWSPELHPDILRLIDELSTSLAEEAPHDAEQPVAT
jgi:hypothetical protein